MATFIIPVSDGTVFPNYEIEVELDGVSYRIDLRYNSRQESWFMTLKDAAGTILRAGISVVSGFPLLQRMKDQTRPDGDIMAMPIAVDSIDAANLEQLGTDVVLTYTGET